MAHTLAACLSSTVQTSGRITLQAPGSSSSAARARLRVTCQATFGGGSAKPGSQRAVREQSPSRVQALAAPAVERQQTTAAEAAAAAAAAAEQRRLNQSQQQAQRDASLEQQRRELESLFGMEALQAAKEALAAERDAQRQQRASAGSTADAAVAAAAALVEEVEAELQQQEQEEELQRRQERQLQSAAASTSGRGQQQQQRTTVLSTRSARLVPRTRGRTAAVPPPPRGNETASAAALASWLLDCSGRRARSTAYASPAAAAAAASPPPAPRGSGKAAAEASPVLAAQRARVAQLAAAVPSEGLSEETKEDMAVLISTRAALRKGRRSRRRYGPSDIMSVYMRSLGNTAVLSKEQEARLASILQKGRQLEQLAAELRGGGGGAAVAAAAISDAELAAVAGLRSAAEVAQRRANQVEAKDLLMQYNVRLVINIAKRYANNGIEIADLIPEGMVGLSKSIDRFEPSKGFKFSTYAHWWIRQAISRAVCDQARVVRLPAHVCETLYRINRAITTLVEQSDRDEPPGYEEIAAEVGLPVQRVIQYLRLAKLPGGGRDRTQYLNGASLKEVTFDDLHELDGDELGVEEEGTEAERQYSCMKAVTDLMLSTLPKRERNILRLRYGLLGWSQPLPVTGMELGVDGDAASMSLGEVAVAYGLSKERIRQIEEKAMRALRKPWRQRLVQELNFGDKISPSSLSHLASARDLAAEEGGWP